MSNFEIRKQLTVDDFNNYGKQILEEHNIDKNKDGVIQGSELNTLFEKVGGGNYGDPDAHWMVAGDISTLLATEDSGMQNTSRVATPEGQAAIENFYNMSKEDRTKVLKQYRDALRVRIEVLHQNYHSIKTKNNGISSRMETLKDILLKKHANLTNGQTNVNEDNDITNILKEYQREFEAYLKSLDGQLADALIEFGGKDVFGNRNSVITEISNSAISKVNVLKQDVKSSFDKLQSLAYQLIYDNHNEQEKADILKVIIENFEQLQERMIKGQEDVESGLESVEMETDKTLNYIEHDKIADYTENGIPTNLDMNNKVAEGVLIDVLMDAKDSSTTGVTSIRTDSKQAPIYDISGKPVKGNLQKGQVYIQNGKKFVAQ